MIQLPRRSVTRFFIPLIDVMILLFCIFLLLPLGTGEGMAVARPESMRQNSEGKAVESGVRRLRKLIIADYQELLTVREGASRNLSGRIAPIILRIDGTDVGLFRDTPTGRVKIDQESNPGQVRRMVQDDRTRLAGDASGMREPYYLLIPPAEAPWVPSTSQKELYVGWFTNVGAAADIGKPDWVPPEGGR